MVGKGNVHRLLWTFLRLRNTCKLASMNIHSDSHGDLKVTVRMTIAGQADQAPRRGGRQSSNQERGPGTQAPSPVAPSAPTTPSPTPAPASNKVTMLKLSAPHVLADVIEYDPNMVTAAQARRRC